ncbi:hypothetical protein A6P55_19930 [Pandoraea pnomenusa]|nr:hypothetical protein A6P55_19930 [Pandoraea pnomenusa]
MSERPASSSVRFVTMPSSDFFSLPSAWARLESFQMLGSSSSLLTSVRRACLTSKSKIPPELADASAQIGEQGFEGVEAFGFHEL